MSEGAPILHFNRAVLCYPGHPEEALRDVSFGLAPGGSAVVVPERAVDNRSAAFDFFPLADAAQGLLPCGPGEVCFMGKDWVASPPLEQARARGRIGRVFDFHGWVHNLTVMDNLTLRCKMHHGKAAADSERAALTLARRMGLDGVPGGRPDGVRKGDLRRLEWVRAFLGSPVLVILERPEMDAPRGSLEGLFETAVDATKRGAAILWITQDDEVVERAVRLGATRYATRGRTWCGREETDR